MSRPLYQKPVLFIVLGVTLLGSIFSSLAIAQSATPSENPVLLAQDSTPVPTEEPDDDDSDDDDAEALAEVLINGFVINGITVIYDSVTNRTTFTYVVTGTGVPPDLSHFDIEIPVCESALEVVAYSPTDAVSFGVDPTTGVNGIKWDLPLRTEETRTYTIVFDGKIVAAPVQIAVKGGNGFESALVLGPSCITADINVEKLVSVDGGLTFNEADSIPGIDADLDDEVLFRFVVSNTGRVDLTDIELTDSDFDLSDCTIPDRLVPDASFDCTVGPFPVEEGQHTNTATVTALHDDEVVSDTDTASYFGGDRPSVSVLKYVASESTQPNWENADRLASARVSSDERVLFRLVVTNDGETPLSNILLTDSDYSTTGCTIPDTLAPGASFECALGPFEVEPGVHQNTATVTATYEDITVTDSDTASYLVQDDLPVIIIIEGPVQEIRANIIIIFGFEIVLDENDTTLAIIRVGDIIRVEGNLSDFDGIFIIVAVNIIFINVDVVIIDDDSVWRDSGDCSNPPPSWAPATGWRRRCEGDRPRGDNDDGDDDDDGMGMGMGMGDD